MKIRYRIPADDGGPGRGDPLTTYQVYSVPDSGSSFGFRVLSWNGTVGTAGGNNKRVDSDDLLFPDDNFGETNPERVFSYCGSHSINGPSLSYFPVAVQTTKTNVGDNSIRVTPWRKAYRAINRFNPRELTFRQVKESEGINGTIKYGLARDAVVFSNGPDDPRYEFPLAIPHRPAAARWTEVENGSHANSDIMITHRITTSSSTGNVLLNSNEISKQLHNEHMDRSRVRRICPRRINNPNVMSFTVNLNDTNNDGGRFTYDYTGLVRKETVVSTTLVVHFEPELVCYE